MKSFEDIPEAQKGLLKRRAEALEANLKKSVDAHEAIKAGRAKLKQLQPK
jgi:hypothetical protein